MRGMALTGIGLVAASLIGLLSAELVTTAHAGRSQPKSYLLAVSAGPTLVLEQALDLAEPGAAEAVRRLRCDMVWRMYATSIGLRCVEIVLPL